MNNPIERIIKRRLKHTEQEYHLAKNEFIRLTNGYGVLRVLATKLDYNYKTLRNLRSKRHALHPLRMKNLQNIIQKIKELDNFKSKS